MVYVPSIIMFVLFFAVVGYFVWKYKEMASESWFQKIQVRFLVWGAWGLGFRV
jgi:hypothetical protein